MVVPAPDVDGVSDALGGEVVFHGKEDRLELMVPEGVRESGQAIIVEHVSISQVERLAVMADTNFDLCQRPGVRSRFEPEFNWVCFRMAFDGSQMENEDDVFVLLAQDVTSQFILFDGDEDVYHQAITDRCGKYGPEGW